MNIEQVVRVVEVRGQTTGMDQVRRAYDGVATASDEAAAAIAKSNAEARNAADAIDRLGVQLQSNFRLQQQFNQMLAQGIAANDNMIAANDNAGRSFAGLSLEAGEAANHLLRAGEAAYAFSPAFREVVNGLAALALRGASVALVGVATGIVTATNLAGTGLVRLGQAAATSSPALAPLAGAVTSAGLAMQAFNPTITAVASSILTRFLPAIRLFGIVSIAIDAARMLGEAWELGGKKLEEYRGIAERAAAVDLSTTFFQKLTKGAEDAKLPVDDITKSLQNLQRVSADALGGSALQQRLDKHLDAGNFAGNPGVAAYNQANTTEERYRAIVLLIRQAMQDGQRLAALDIAGTAFGPEAAEHLRQDSEYFDKIQAAADRVSEKRLISDADIGGALDLQRRYDAAVTILEQRWHPIQDLLTQLGIKMRQVWVDIVEAIARGVDTIVTFAANVADMLDKVYGKVRQTIALVPDWAKRGASAAASLVAGAVAGPVAGAAVGAATGLYGGGDNQEKATATDAYSNAVNRLTANLKNANTTQQAMNAATAVTYKVVRDTSNALDQQTKAVAAQKNAFDSAVQATEKHIARMEADAKSVGLGVGAQEQMRAAAVLTTAAQQAGIPITKELAAYIDQLAQKAGAAATNLAKVKIDNDIKFQKDTVGLSAEDVQIAQQLRTIYPDVQEAMASVEAQEMRVLNAQHLLADGFRDVGQSIFTAFATGKNVMDAMLQSLDNLAKKLADAAFNNIIDGLLSGNLLQAGLGAVEAGVSALISAFTGDQKKKEEEAKALKEAQDAWAKMKDQVIAFNHAAAGFDLGPITQNIQSLVNSYTQLAEAANKAKDYGAVAQLQATFNLGLNRLVNSFISGTPVMTDLQQKMQAVMNEGQGMIETLISLGAATDATIRAIQDSINRQQSDLQRAFIAETEAALLADVRNNAGLGYLNTIGEAVKKFNDDIAQGISSGVSAARLYSVAQAAIESAGLTGDAITEIARLFPQLSGAVHDSAKAIEDAANKIKAINDDLEAKINSLSGRGYLNDVKQLFADQATDLAGGADPALVAQYFKLQAQAIVDGAQLAGTAFDDLLKTFPQLKDVVHAFVQTSSSAADALSRATQQLQQYLDNLRGGSDSTAAPVDRLAASQEAYSRSLSQYKAGTADVSVLTQAADNLRTAARDYYGSTQGYQDIYAKIQSDIAGLIASGTLAGGVQVAPGVTVASGTPAVTPSTPAPAAGTIANFNFAAAFASLQEALESRLEEAIEEIKKSNAIAEGASIDEVAQLKAINSNTATLPSAGALALALKS